MIRLWKSGMLAGLIACTVALNPARAAESTAPAVQVQPLPSAPTSQPLPAPARLVALPDDGFNVPAAPLLVPVPTAPAVASTDQQRRLNDLVLAFVDYGNQDAEQECLAGAIYFEARGETLEGQLAVAQVILNRTLSGVYPASICGVVTQPAQFSFVRNGGFPPIDRSSACWHKALAIADVARKKLIRQVPENVLWYHASYVSPSWGQRLARVAQIGSHIFYQKG